MSQNAPGVNCKVSLHESSSGTWSADGGVEQFGHKEQTFHSGLFCLEWQHAGCSARHDVRCEKNCQRISVSWSQNQNLSGQIIELYRWIRGWRGYLSRLYFLSKWVFPKNRGTPKSSILIGFSTINHPFWVVFPLFLETPKWFALVKSCHFTHPSRLNPSSVLWRCQQRYRVDWVGSLPSACDQKMFMMYS